MNKRIWVADFETSTINTNFFKFKNDSIVYLWYIENLQKETNFKGTTINGFIDVIHRYPALFDIIYFHNLSFDGYFILKALVNEYELNYVTEFKDWNELGVNCLRSGNKIYQIKWRFNFKGRVKEVTFKCSLRLLSSSVQALGKDVGMNKYTGEEPDNFYDNEPLKSFNSYPKLFTDYMINDVKIVKQSLLEFDKAIQSINCRDFEITWYKFLTIGAISFKIQEHYFEKVLPNESIFTDKKTYEIAEKFYYGGWTQFNPSIQNQVVDVDGYSVDINSMYPWAMTNLLPYGELVNDINLLDKDKPILTYYKIHVFSAVAKNMEVVNLLNWSKRNKSIDANELRYVQFLTNFDCYYLKEEWEMLQKFYTFEGVTIVEKFYSQADYWCKEFIEKLYNLRLEFKSKNQNGLANGIKILLNSGYGKHASREQFSNEVVLTKEEFTSWCRGLREYGINSIKVKDKSYIPIGINNFFETARYVVLVCDEVDKQNIKYYNKLAAATITAYGRIRLWEAISCLNEGDFLYADTDSIYFKNAINFDNIPTDDKTLGAFKKEDTFKQFITSGAKVYAIFDENSKNIKAKYSGLKQSWLKENVSFDIYKDMGQVFKDANLKPEYLKSGIVLKYSDYKPSKRNL